MMGELLSIAVRKRALTYYTGLEGFSMHIVIGRLTSVIISRTLGVASAMSSLRLQPRGAIAFTGRSLRVAGLVEHLPH